MSISITTPNHGAMAGAGWIVNGTSSDASGCEQLLAAPGVGFSLLVDFIMINSDSTITITIGEGETTPGSVDTALIGPVAFNVGTTLSWDFRSHGGIELTENTSLVVDASGSGNICVFLLGRTI